MLLPSPCRASMAVVLCAVSSGFVAMAQQPADDLGPNICPLSDEQTRKSLEAFDKLVPTFHHPRCERCHGGLDVFAENTAHGGGQQGDDTGCDTCHDRVPGGGRWQLPIPAHFFVHKDAKTLCEQMHDTSPTRAILLEHLGTDQLIQTAFLGTRGLSPMDLESEHLAPEPPPVTRDAFLGMAGAWFDAMGGDFKGEVPCGCEPQRYAVRVSYKREVKLGIVNSTETMGPVDIPIRFHDDGSFDGEQTVYFNGNSMAFICTATSTGSMNLKVSGEVTGEWPNEQMSLKLENTTVMKNGTIKAVCPGEAVTRSLESGEKASVEEDDIPGRVGSKVHFAPSAGVPGMTTSIDAEVVQINR